MLRGKVTCQGNAFSENKIIEPTSIFADDNMVCHPLAFFSCCEKYSIRKLAESYHGKHDVGHSALCQDFSTKDKVIHGAIILDGGGAVLGWEHLEHMAWSMQQEHPFERE